jgi:hypothetical protein
MNSTRSSTNVMANGGAKFNRRELESRLKVLHRQMQMNQIVTEVA